MTNKTRITSGYILLSVPTIIYGGYFLLSVMSGQHQELALTEFQKSMFRAGHAHAGVCRPCCFTQQMEMACTTFISSSCHYNKFRIFCRSYRSPNYATHRTNIHLVYWYCRTYFRTLNIRHRTN
jgi:hypothetical protein